MDNHHSIFNSIKYIENSESQLWIVPIILHD